MLRALFLWYNKIKEGVFMKYNRTMKIYGKAYYFISARKVYDKETKKAIFNEYRNIIERAGDIGQHNLLLNSYALAAYFIALVRKSGKSADENIKLLEDGISGNPLVKLVLGTNNSYFNEKRMKQRYEWAKQTKQRKYKNDWVVEVRGKNEERDMSYDYYECGVCKLCNDEGCPELAKYLCRLDFLLVETMGIGLKRTQTIAEGAEYCDFRFYKK